MEKLTAILSLGPWGPMVDFLPLKQDILIKLIKRVCQVIVCDSGIDDEDILELCEEYWETPTGNDTVLQITDISNGSKVVLSVLYALIFIMALVGNIVVLMAFCSMRNLRGVSTNVLLVNLAVSDLLVTAFCMPFNVVVIHTRWWDFGVLSSFTCKSVPYAQGLAVVASILTLTCIAAERYVAIVLPLKARTMNTSCRTVVLLTYIWGMAIAFAVPNALWYTLIDLKDIEVGGDGDGGSGGGFFRSAHQRSEDAISGRIHARSNIPCDTHTNTSVNKYFINKGTDQTLNYYRYNINNASTSIINNLPTPISMPDDLQNPLADLKVPDLSSAYLCVLSAENTERMKIYQFMFFGLLFVAPLVMMVFMYSEVSYRLWFRHKIGNQSITFDQMRLRTSKRVVTILIVVLLLFVVCWAPLQIYTLYLFITSPEVSETNLNLRYYFQWLALSNSALNPLVYTFLHEKFRKTVENGCCHKKNKVHTSSSAEPRQAHTSEQQGNHGNSSNGTANTNSSPVPTKY